MATKKKAKKKATKRKRNESPFQGWREYKTGNGTYRFEWRGSGIWSVYEERNGSFEHVGRFRAPEKASAVKLMDEYYEMIARNDEDF